MIDRHTRRRTGSCDDDKRVTDRPTGASRGRKSDDQEES